MTTIPKASEIRRTRKLLTVFTNHWRQRNVSLFDHPDDRYVYSIGALIGATGITDDDYIVCEEPKKLYEKELRRALVDPIKGGSFINREISNA